MKEFIRSLSLQPLVFLATVFLIVAILSLAQRILVPVALAVLFSFLLGPLVRWVQRKGLQRTPAVVLVTLVATVLTGILVWAILSQFVALANNMDIYKANIVKKIRSMRGEENSVVGKMVDAADDVSEELEAQEEKKKARPVVIQTNLGELISFYAATASEIIRLAASVGMVMVLVIVMLLYREEVRDRFIRLTGATRLTVTTKALDEAAQRISDYMLRKSIVNFSYGAVITVVLFFLGVPFAILWGFLVAVLRFIPGLGLWLALAPPMVLSLIAFESWWPLVVVGAVFLLAELITLNLVEPRFLGPQIGLLPVATMVSLSFWTWLWGPVGLLLGIPITVSLAVLGK